MALGQLIYDKDDLDSSADTATKKSAPCHMKDNYSRSNKLFRGYSPYDCAPGLILTESEDSSFASCGTEEFFDLEEISNSLKLIENWKKHHRRVKFSSVRVQEHAITVGDHPICKDGLALSLDWAHAEEKVYDIDNYESRRERENQLRRMRGRRRVSKLDYWQRRETLVRVGDFSLADLSRIECTRNRQAVSEFLQDLGTEDYGPPVLEMEEEGIEVEEMFDGIEFEVFTDEYEDEEVKPSPMSSWRQGWQMNVQVLEE